MSEWITHEISKMNWYNMEDFRPGNSPRMPVLVKGVYNWPLNIPILHSKNALGTNRIVSMIKVGFYKIVNFTEADGFLMDGSYIHSCCAEKTVILPDSVDTDSVIHFSDKLFLGNVDKAFLKKYFGERDFFTKDAIEAWTHIY